MIIRSFTGSVLILLAVNVNSGTVTLAAESDKQQAVKANGPKIEDSELDELTHRINSYLDQARQIIWDKTKKNQDRVREAKVQYALAKPLLEKLLAKEQSSTSDQRTIALISENLGKIAYFNNQLAEAIPLLRRSLEISEKIDGSGSTRRKLYFLANLYLEQHDFRNAEQLYKNAVASSNYLERTGNDPFIAGAHKGTVHESYLHDSLNDLARFYCDQERYSDAEPYFLQVLAIREKSSGPLALPVVQARQDLFYVLSKQSKKEQQESLYKDLVRTVKERKSSESDVANSLSYLAWCYCHLGKYDEAERVLHEELSIRNKTQDQELPCLAANIQNLATVLDKSGKTSQAEEYYKRLIELCKSSPRLTKTDELIATIQLTCFYWRHNNLAMVKDMIDREQFLLAQIPKADGWRGSRLEIPEQRAWFYYSSKQYSKAETLFKKLSDTCGLELVYKSQNKQKDIEQLRAKRINSIAEDRYIDAVVPNLPLTPGSYSEAEKACQDALTVVRCTIYDLRHLSLERIPLYGAANSIDPGMTEIHGVNIAGQCADAASDTGYPPGYRAPQYCFGGAYTNNDQKLRAEPIICSLPLPDLWISPITTGWDRVTLKFNGEVFHLKKATAQACIQLQLANIYRKEGKAPEAEVLSKQATAEIKKLGEPQAESILSKFTHQEQH